MRASRLVVVPTHIIPSPSRRQKAIDFAKNVPKPRAPTQPRQQPAGGGDFDDSESADAFGERRGGAGTGVVLGQEYGQESRIMELEAQHHIRKIQIEAMKKSLGLK